MRTTKHAMFWLLTCACALCALPALGQSALAPQIAVANYPPLPPNSIPTNAPFVAQAYFFGPAQSAYSNLTDVVLDGTVLTARYQSACASTCSPDVYAGHLLNLPALPDGTYTLRVTTASDGLVWAEYPIVTGSTLAAIPDQMYTIPQQPANGRPFSVRAFFLAFAHSWYAAPVSIAGSTITARVTDSGCGFLCPPFYFNLYGPANIDLPALPAGKYTLRVIEYYDSSVLYAEFPLAVQALDPVPAMDPGALLLLFGALLLTARTRLRHV